MQMCYSINNHLCRGERKTSLLALQSYNLFFSASFYLAERDYVTIQDHGTSFL